MHEGDTGGGVGEGDDSKSDGSYDPLFDEPEVDAVPDLTNGSQDRGLDLSLPGTVPNPQFNRHMPSNAVAKNAPPLLDPHTYSTYSSDVLMTASIDGQIFLWDRRVETQGKGVGRLFMSDRTPPWCVSVGSSLLPYPARIVLTSLGLLVSERHPSLCWTEKRHGRYLGRAEIRIEQQNASTSEGPQKSSQFRRRLMRRCVPRWASPRFVSFCVGWISSNVHLIRRCSGHLLTTFDYGTLRR